MSATVITDLERTNLEAHVDLCAERYRSLDIRLSVLEVKMDKISLDITNSNRNMSTVVISSAGAIVASLIGLITTILMKF
jgi:hypothetical protein